MNKKRWLQLEPLLDQALHYDTDKERTDFLKSVCKEDAVLFEELISLLSSIHESDKFWDDLLNSGKILMDDMTLSGYQAEELPAADLPESIGDYTVKKILGRGGMGDVYLAERSDAPFLQPVALKVFRNVIGLISDEQVRRFIQERNILSSLNHPNIARLIDGGVTNDGRPWFVMEFVDGLTITNYCKQNQCTLHERLELFTQVCRAVQYAHTNFIVHRDIKPDNLLVNRKGEVKVLDFGIAKLLNRNVSDRGLRQTRAGRQMLSLNYAAPEQITLEPITTATDVYALGLLLFELLTDRQVFSLNKKTLKEAEFVIRNSEPPKPSSISEQWRNLLKGDLDAIVSKALRKEPEYRYELPNQLLDDIIRYREMRPVLARRGSFNYRFGKFLQRNRTVLMASIVSLVLVSAFGIYHIQQMNEQRNIALTEAERAEQISNFMIELFEAGSPYENFGDTLTVLSIMERGVSRAEGLADQPHVQAQLLHTIGSVYFQLNRYGQSQPLIEKAYEIRSSLLPGEDRSLNETRYLLATIYHHHGDYQRAMPLYEKVTRYYRQMPHKLNEEAASSLTYLGDVQNYRQNFAEGEKLYHESLDLKLQLYGRDHSSTALSVRGLAWAVLNQGRSDEAFELYREALDIYRKLEEDHAAMARTLTEAGSILEERGDLDSAERFYREAVDIHMRIYGPRYAGTAVYFQFLANILRDKGEFQEALELYNKAEELNRIRFGERSHLIGRGFIDRAVLLSLQNLSAEADSMFIAGTSMLRQTLPAGNPHYSRAQMRYGLFLKEHNRFEEAEHILLESYNDLKTVSESNAMYLKDLASSVSLLADLYSEWNRREEADAFAGLRQELSTY